MSATLVIQRVDDAFAAAFPEEASALSGARLNELVAVRDREAVHALHFDLITDLRVGDRTSLARLAIDIERDHERVISVELLREEALVERLAVVDAHWRDAWRASRDGMALLGRDGRVVVHNPAFVTLAELGAEDHTLDGVQLVHELQGHLPRLADYLRAPQGLFSSQLTDSVGALEIEGRPVEHASGKRVGTAISIRRVVTDSSEAAKQRDLVRARTLQRTVFGSPPVIAGWHVEAAYQPLEHVGGDLYDVTLLPDQRLRMFIADVNGHGIAAAMVAMLVKANYDAIKRSEATPAELLARLNDQITHGSRSFDLMFTAALVEIALPTRVLVHASASHPPPLVVEHGAVRELETGGTFMGVSRGRRYPSWSHELPPGASLVLVTDGLAEARNVVGDQYGDARLRDSIARSIQAGGPVSREVARELVEWVAPSAPGDDMTMLVLRPR